MTTSISDLPTIPQRGARRRLAVSGKMGSGKDTLAHRALELVGAGAVVQLNIGDAIRAELDACFAAYRDGGAGTLDAQFATLPSSSDLLERVDALDTDALVLTSDVREPLEVLALREAGYVIVRVEVTEETQIERLTGRDGLIASTAALRHPNECALDDPTPEVLAAYAAVVANDGELDDAARAVAATLSGHWGRGHGPLFVVFEGIEGCGKSTLSRRVRELLAQSGVDVIHTREPGGTTIGQTLREQALSTRHDVVTESLLFAADRAEHVAAVVRPALDAGQVVLCDRYEASSIAYQGAWRGLGEARIAELSSYASRGLHADLTVWLRIDPTVAAARRTVPADELDAIASRSDVANVLHDSFAAQSTRAGSTWWVVDATLAPERLARAVAEGIMSRLRHGDVPAELRAQVSPFSTGTLLLVTGPSGSGKNSVMDRCRRRHPDLWYSVSVTTRAPRAGEIDGIDYHFVNDAAFERLIDDGGLLEWASYAGQRYGTPAAPVRERLARGEDVVCIVEFDGAEQIKRAEPEANVVFIAPPSWDILEQRLRARGTESADALRARLDIARDELARGPVLADTVIINDDIDRAADELAALLH